MDPLRIDGHEWRIEHAHPLMLAGLLEGYDETTERPALRLAYLGLCLRPLSGAKLPLRRSGEPLSIFGGRVYDYLIEMGGNHWDLMAYSAAALNEAAEALPLPPTVEEVRHMGKPSTGTTSSTGSDSPSDGPETP
jgi:hypothetical protein